VQVSTRTQAAPCAIVRLSAMALAPITAVFSRPVFLRELSGKPDLFEITFLRSEGPEVQGHRAVAFRARLAHAGDNMLLKAADDDPVASKKLGQYILWELDDPTGARPYLERAVEAGADDAAIDLAIAAIFATPRSDHLGFAWRSPLGAAA
jgi:TPR repeat protein